MQPIAERLSRVTAEFARHNRPRARWAISRSEIARLFN